MKNNDHSSPEDNILSGRSLIFTISKNRNLLIILGVLLALTGIIAILFPLISSIYIIILIGATLLISGTLQTIQAFRHRTWSNLVLAFFAGIFWIVAGLILLSRPEEGVAVFTLFLAIAFLAEGVLKLLLAFKMRENRGWKWIMIDGAIAAILGVLLWVQFPYSAMWAIGVLTGINIFSSGVAAIIVAVTCARDDNS